MNKRRRREVGREEICQREEENAKNERHGKENKENEEDK